MRTASLLLMLLLAPACLAQIYSWRDAEGKMHYSDQPPVGVANTRKVEPNLAPAEDSDKARQRLAKEQMDFRKRQLEAGESAVKAERAQKEAAERQENCKQAKSYLQALESGERIARSNDKGEREFLDDQGRAQETISARRAVAASCN